MKMKRFFLGIFKVFQGFPKALRSKAQFVAAMILMSPLMAFAKVPDNIMKEILTSEQTLGIIRGVLTAIAIGLVAALVWSLKEGNKEGMLISGILAGFTIWLIQDWNTFVGWIAG